MNGEVALETQQGRLVATFSDALSSFKIRCQGRVKGKERKGETPEKKVFLFLCMGT